MVLKPGTREQILVVDTNNVSCEWIKDFPTVFSDVLGKIKGFKHKIKMKDGAHPAKHKLRGVPFSVKTDLEKELKRLCNEEIIEPIESSLWLSPLVLAKKKNW